MTSKESAKPKSPDSVNDPTAGQVPPDQRAKPSSKAKSVKAKTSDLSTRYLDYWQPRYWLSWLTVGCMWLIAHLPWPLQRRLGAALGWLAYRFSASRRHTTQVNIRLCFPELTPQAQHRLVIDTFIANGIGFIETCMAWFRDPEIYRHKVRLEGMEYLQQGLAEKRGILLIGGHFTTLDLAGALVRLFVNFSVSYRPHNNPVLNAVMVRRRLRLFEHAFLGEDVRGFIRALRAGKVFWLAPDQDYGRKKSIFADFFAIPTATISAPGKLIKATGATPIFLSYFREPDNSGWLLRFRPAPETFPSGDEISDANCVNQWLEEEIRSCPEQYLWLHRRFKTRPRGSAKLY